MLRKGNEREQGLIAECLVCSLGKMEHQRPSSQWGEMRLERGQHPAPKKTFMARLRILHFILMTESIEEKAYIIL